MTSKKNRWIATIAVAIILPGCIFNYQNYHYSHNKHPKEENLNYILIGNNILLNKNTEKKPENQDNFTWNIEKISDNEFALIYGERESDHIVMAILCDSDRDNGNYLSISLQKNIELDDSGDVTILSGGDHLSFKYKKSAIDDYENYDIRSRVPNLSNVIDSMSSRRSIILTKNTSQMVNKTDRSLASEFIKICRIG